MRAAAAPMRKMKSRCHCMPATRMRLGCPPHQRKRKRRGVACLLWHGTVPGSTCSLQVAHHQPRTMRNLSLGRARHPGSSFGGFRHTTGGDSAGAVTRRAPSHEERCLRRDCGQLSVPCRRRRATRRCLYVPFTAPLLSSGGWDSGNAFRPLELSPAR